MERLNSTSKTSIPALAQMGLSSLAATSAGAVEPIAWLRCACRGNFMAGPCDPGVGGFNSAEVGSVGGSTALTQASKAWFIPAGPTASMHGDTNRTTAPQRLRT